MCKMENIIDRQFNYIPDSTTTFRLTDVTRLFSRNHYVCIVHKGIGRVSPALHFSKYSHHQMLQHAKNLPAATIV